MAKKKSGLGSRRYVGTFLAVVLVLLVACSKEEPSASVPTDCQQFLDNYFGAWKSKDLATLQALCYYLSPEARSRLPQGSLELWREGKNKLVTENFEGVTGKFGDVKSYDVLRAKTTRIARQDQT